jgi:membrane associated rhomboid family serine protease
MVSAKSWFFRQGRPGTMLLIAAIVIGSLTSWALSKTMIPLFAFMGSPIPKIWTVFSYPFVGFVGPIGLLFTSLWLYFIGGKVEAHHGFRNYLLVWFAFSALAVLPLIFVKGSSLGPQIPIACLTVMWATKHPTEMIRLFMCIPVRSVWIAALSIAVVFFSYALTGALLLHGVLACLGCGLAYLYASNRIPGVSYAFGYGTYTKPRKTKAQKNREEAYYSDVFMREKEREERERLRKLFESSIDDDEKRSG